MENMNNVMKAQAQANGHKEANTDEAKAKKAASAKAWKEKKQQEAKELTEFAKAIKVKLEKANVKLTADEQKVLDRICNPSARASSGGSPLFNKLFGDSPKVGDSVTLMDAFKRTFKSKPEIDRYVKQWAEKGIKIEYESAAEMAQSKFVIKELAAN